MPLASLLLISLAVAADPTMATLRLNQIQVVGTHNSYHLRPPQEVYQVAVSVRPEAKEWDYSREPLDRQLDRGIRNFELDLHRGDEWLVMHVPLFDGESTVRTFREALELVKAWSDRHPRHVPISFLIELKREGVQLSREIRRPERDDVLQLDEIIRDVFPPERLITPDDVRGDHPTLPAAIESTGWPTLAESAGKVLLILHDTGRNRQLYLEGAPALQARAMFVNSTPGQPHAATLVLDNPASPRLDELARAGYLIRTRVDGQRNPSATRRAKALSTGAHILTTDYPLGEIAEAEAFFLPNRAVARANPVTAPTALAEKDLTEPIPAAEPAE